MQQSGTIYIYAPQTATPSQKKKRQWPRTIGAILLMLSLGGIVGPLLPALRLESNYYLTQAKSVIFAEEPPEKTLPPSVPVVFNPLKLDDGSQLSPVNQDFSLIIPKIGVNSPIIPAVDPTDPKTYDDALLKGVAHASTSFFPNENGTVYLFSHSTNYDWFVSDLNAVFYLIKNLNQGDTIVIYYKNKQYVYKLTEKRVVSPDEVSYLLPQSGKKRLILQTCWPPGSTSERLLIFADLIQEDGKTI